jgi:hypothetical protein
MKMKKYYFALIVFISAAATFAGCDLMRSDAGGGSPHLVIRLTDAPKAEMVAALVSIDLVEIRSADSVSTILSNSAQVFDLLSLQDDSSIVLVDRTIPVDTYSQLRLHVGSEATVEFDDGSTQDLIIPSGQQTGIKILLQDVDLYSSEDTLAIMLDFDAHASFVSGSADGPLLFKPVIKIKDAEVAGKKLDIQ